MIPLLSSAQIRAWDTYTMERGKISAFELMEQAAGACVQHFCSHYHPSVAVYVIAGTGNNGGDGLCVARLLGKRDYNVQVFIFGKPEKLSPTCKEALERAQQAGVELEWVKTARKLSRTPLFKAKKNNSVWIDALFGTGLRRPLEGEEQEAVEALNALEVPCVAVDSPSGLLLDAPQRDSIAVRASRVISLQVPKLPFLLPTSERYVGDWEAVDIGLDHSFLGQISPKHGYLMEEKDLRAWLPLRPRHLHKGKAGRAFLVAGSQGMFGAAILAATAALRTGAGLVHAHVPGNAVNVLHTAVPEALIQADRHATHISHAPIPEHSAAIAVGPGLQQLPCTAQALKSLLNTSKPLILDADALNLIALDSNLLAKVPKNSLLTPHAGELERLTGTWSDDHDKLERLRNFCEKTKCVVLLKGAYTLIAVPGEPFYFNPTGNPGMATAGSGDVLTGVLLALCAAKVAIKDAARLGAFLHGRAGDLAAAHKGSHGLLSRDICRCPSRCYFVASGLLQGFQVLVASSLLVNFQGAILSLLDSF